MLTQLEDIATDIDDIRTEPSPAAHVVGLDDGAVSVRVTYRLGDPDRRTVLAVRSAYAMVANRRLEAAGITISPATVTDLEGAIGIHDAGASR